MAPCGSVSSSSSSGCEAGLRCREPGSLTGQNAEPVGMKLTLFLSGQEKSGTDADADCLELQKKHTDGHRVREEEERGQSL